MNIFRDKSFTSVALGHLTVDILNGQRLVLLAYLSLIMGLNNTTLGIVSTIYMLTGALAQPVFGWLADRWGPRWLITGGILWMGTFAALTVTSTGTLSLVFLVISSVGSGVFHPAGAMQSALRGKHHLSGREGTSMALFFLFGQLGYFFGPVLSGRLLDSIGLHGLLFIAALVVPVAAFNAWSLRFTGPTPKPEKSVVNQASTRSKVAWTAAAALFIALAAQAMSQGTMNAFLPRYLAELGQSPSKYGFLSALFMGGAAIGNLIGGSLSDRMSRYLVIAIGMITASLPIYLIGRTTDPMLHYILIPLGGIFAGMAYTVIVVLGQRMLPVGMGMASGLVLTLSFSSSAIGPLVAGYLADKSGLASVFTLTGAIALTGGLAALGIGRQKEVPGPVMEELVPAGEELLGD